MSIDPSSAGAATRVARQDPIDHSAVAIADGLASRHGLAWAAVEPGFRQLIEALGVAVYTTDAAGRLTFYNDAAAAFWGRRPELGELWCGSYRLFWPDGRAMSHVECPMAIALLEGRELRGVEAIAERPDGSRISFNPYPTLLRDPDGSVAGAVNVLVDVTERKRAEDELRAAAEALRASNAVKDEFLGLVSHELRTPVTTIYGNARLLRDKGGRLAPEAKDSMVGDIAAEAERLLGLVENLLLLTRLEAGVDPEPEPQLLGHVARQMVASFRRRHPDRSFALAVEPGRAIVEADRPYLDLLFENLIGNALKYSARGTPIDITIDVSGEEARVRVLDRGIGVPEDDASRIFEPFVRGENARESSPGLGIGLAACRRVVEGLGGRAWTAPRDGGGSEFGFALPLA